MTRRLASQPPPASSATAPRALTSRPHPVRTPPHSCGTAFVPEASTRGPAPAITTRRAVLCSARPSPAQHWPLSAASAQITGGVCAQSWQSGKWSPRGSMNGETGGRASAAQGSADISRRWEGEEAQRDWSTPAVAVAPDSGLIERATDAMPSSSQDSTYAASSVDHAESRSGNGAGPPAAEGDVLIELHDVGKAFGKKAILKGATMKIRRGEAVGIIGGSGTGKSTTLRLMAGLLEPDSGQVVVQGVPRKGLLTDDDAGAGLHIGMVFQSGALFDSLTVGENVGFLLYEHSDLPRDHIQRLVARALGQVGLSGVEDLYPAELSGGMKKRVALARAIIRDDENDTSEQVVMYDEPTAGLDPVASTVVEDLIRSLHVGRDGGDTSRKAGGISAYIVVTHQHSTIRRAVDRLVFLHEGRVVWEGTTDEFENSEIPIVKQFRTGGLKGPIQYL